MKTRFSIAQLSDPDSSLGPAQPFEATSSAPQPIKTMPSQFAGVRRSPKNTTPKTATRTIESLSTGATREASPSFKARK
jgi:hypothetical protein